MKVGVSGTQKGITAYQTHRVFDLLDAWDWSQLHHGNCVGADEEIAFIALEMRGYTSLLEKKQIVIAHPTIHKQQSEKSYFDEIRPNFPPLVRNHNIVDAVQRMIICPGGIYTLRSGTWATFRYAVKRHKIIHLIPPEEGFNLRLPEQYG